MKFLHYQLQIQWGSLQVSRDLPAVTSPLPRDLQQFVQRVREALDSGGDNAVVTARQLIVAGLASTNSTGHLTTVVDNTIQNPSPPTNLSASGAMANIIVSWNAPTYSGHAYTEIWAHTSDNLGGAQLVGMTAGNNFAHNIGGTATRYYWVRNINQNGLASAYNAVSGVVGSTSSSPNFLMELLVETYGTNSQSPFFQIDSATTINGVSVPAGTYMKNAFIHNASITNAMVQDAAIDNAKIANLDAVKINAGTLDAARIGANSITASMINSNGLSIKDTSGNIILSAGTPLAVNNVSGLGSLATANTVGVSSVTGLGALATANTVGVSSVTGLGSFATLSSITSSNVTTYIANGAIQTAQIADANITNAKIGNTIQSSNYSSGSAGWKIDKTGQIEANDATFRGTLDVANASSGSRLKITSTKIEVFDGSTLRVKIGDLS